MQRWSDGELEVMRTKFGHIPIESVCAMLPARTEEAVVAKARQIGVFVRKRTFVHRSRRGPNNDLLASFLGQWHLHEPCAVGYATHRLNHEVLYQ